MFYYDVSTQETEIAIFLNIKKPPAVWKISSNPLSFLIRAKLSNRRVKWVRVLDRRFLKVTALHQKDVRGTEGFFFSGVFNHPPSTSNGVYWQPWVFAFSLSKVACAIAAKESIALWSTTGQRLASEHQITSPPSRLLLTHALGFPGLQADRVCWCAARPNLPKLDG